MSFKTQAEIWQHLLNGGMVKHKVGNTPVKLMNGFVVHNDESDAEYIFNIASDWMIYEEPKRYELEVVFRRGMTSGIIFPDSTSDFDWKELENKKFKMTLEEIK